MTEGNVYRGNQIMNLFLDEPPGKASVVTADLGEITMPATEQDRFLLAEGESLTLYISGSVPSDPPKFGRAEIEYLAIWQESADLESDKSSGGNRMQPPPSGFRCQVVCDGDVEVILERTQVQFTHLHKASCGSAHYRFGLRLKRGDAQADWDPDVHDYGGSG